MSITERIKSFLAPSSPALKVVTVRSTADYEELPKGFFRCVTNSSVESLGYNGGFLCWAVGETVVDDGKRITLTVPRSELPLVRLNFSRQTNGAQHVGGSTIIDTDSLDGDNTVVWDGQPPRSGVDYF